MRKMDFDSNVDAFSALNMVEIWSLRSEKIKMVLENFMRTVESRTPEPPEAKLAPFMADAAAIIMLLITSPLLLASMAMRESDEAT